MDSVGSTVPYNRAHITVGDLYTATVEFIRALDKEITFKRSVVNFYQSKTEEGTFLDVAIETRNTTSFEIFTVRIKSLDDLDDGLKVKLAMVLK